MSETPQLCDDLWQSLPLKDWCEYMRDSLCLSPVEPSLAVRDTTLWALRRLTVARPRNMVRKERQTEREREKHQSIPLSSIQFDRYINLSILTLPIRSLSLSLPFSPLSSVISLMTACYLQFMV